MVLFSYRNDVPLTEGIELRYILPYSNRLCFLFLLVLGKLTKGLIVLKTRHCQKLKCETDKFSTFKTDMHIAIARELVSNPIDQQWLYSYKMDDFNSVIV